VWYRLLDVQETGEKMVLPSGRREVALIQTTTADHLADRLTKVKATPELPGLLAAGCKDMGCQGSKPAAG
jgi:hypothetical protein